MRAGGELFYAPLGAPYSDARMWRIPPLVRDGRWHVLSLPLDAIRDRADWEDSGQMSRFRFDPTNADGGRLEISEIRFRVRTGPAAAMIRNRRRLRPGRHRGIMCVSRNWNRYEQFDG